mmetsp:Transcript_47134/g.131536  ORF Transcript_47134/g.131536 Transcript_47134/m.131536 type:complete len:120 (-) Transcript_47134:499-858(-)
MRRGTTGHRSPTFLPRRPLQLGGAVRGFFTGMRFDCRSNDDDELHEHNDELHEHDGNGHDDHDINRSRRLRWAERGLTSSITFLTMLLLLRGALLGDFRVPGRRESARMSAAELRRNAN